LNHRKEDDVKLTTQQRLDRIEKAINGIAYFETRLAAIAIRAEQHGSIIPGGQEREIRPLAPLPERRAA
jgi:hypothetical protein